MTDDKAPLGLLALVGLGPGDLQQMTIEAKTVLGRAEVVIGYQVYVDLVRPLLRSTQEIIISSLGRELERAKQAVDLAAAGRRVALISSGDVGIYGMASPVFELLHQRGWQGDNPEVAVWPGISAVQAVSARLGAPLGHDFCTISLSDLLTPWPVIERRIQAVAWGDFVIAFYNPRSQKRNWQLQQAITILLTHRSPTTPVAIVRNVTRPDEAAVLTTLAKLNPTQVDMLTLVLVGNSQSYAFGKWLVTPRGYAVDDGVQPAIPGAESLPRIRPAKGGEVSQFSPRWEELEGGNQDAHGEGYPITLINTAKTWAVVIGGGLVGQRKVEKLLATGARVRLISPKATPQLQAWAETGQIQWLRRGYQSGDLAGAQLVFAATNQRKVNAQVAQEAQVLKLLCNVADHPAEGNFHVPAVHRQPGLVVAVSTAGESPSRAREMRDKIARWLEGSNSESR